jgi:hypothetical protein
MCGGEFSLLASGFYSVNISSADGVLMPVNVPYGSCVDKCSRGQYEDSFGVCKPCDENCRECDIIPTNCTVCPALSPFKKRRDDGGVSCVRGCGNGYFADMDFECKGLRLLYKHSSFFFIKHVNRHARSACLQIICALAVQKHLFWMDASAGLTVLQGSG